MGGMFRGQDAVGNAECGTGWEAHHHNLAMLHSGVNRHPNCCCKVSWLAYPLKGEFWVSDENARRSQGESSNTKNTHQKHSQQLSSRVVGLLHLFLSRSGCLSFGWKINSR